MRSAREMPSMHNKSYLCRVLVSRKSWERRKPTDSQEPQFSNALHKMSSMGDRWSRVADTPDAQQEDPSLSRPRLLRWSIRPNQNDEIETQMFCRDIHPRPARDHNRNRVDRILQLLRRHQHRIIGERGEESTDYILYQVFPRDPLCLPRLSAY